jgi:hypothetical protein
VARLAGCPPLVEFISNQSNSKVQFAIVLKAGGWKPLQPAARIGCALEKVKIALRLRRESIMTLKWIA